MRIKFLSLLDCKTNVIILTNNDEYSELDMETSIQQQNKLGGKRYYCLFLAGAKKVIEHQQELNKINVFPVPDADTGTNIASTMRYIIDSVKPHESFKITATRIAEAALDGSRGNSGAIFTQFLYGISAEATNEEMITIPQLANLFQSSVSYVYDAISNPVEGTILTVIREWAFSYLKNSKIISDEEELFRKACMDAQISLEATAPRMKELVGTEVIDAGGKAFVLFLEGIIEFMENSDLKKLVVRKSKVYVPDEIDEFSHNDCKFRYCSEALIQGENLDRDLIKRTLRGMGDSVVIIGAKHKIRIHIHTDTPAKLFAKLEKFGTLVYQKVDDIQKQIEIAHNRKWKIAIVTDSTCDIPDDLFDKYQIHMIPIDVYFGDNHYIDKMTITPDEFYTKMTKTKEKMSSSQPNMKLFLNNYSYLATHYDSVIAIHLSEPLSGTYYRSKKAADVISAEMGKKITVINSKNVAGTLGLIVLHAAEKVIQGLNHDEVVDSIMHIIDRSRIYINVSTIEYLVRGGRISPLKGMIGKMVNLKPVIEIDNSGKLVVTDYAFSIKSSVNKVIKKIKFDLKYNHISKYVIFHAHDHKKAKWYSDLIEAVIGIPPEYIIEISPVVGLNAGIGAIAVGYILE